MSLTIRRYYRLAVHLMFVACLGPIIPGSALMAQTSECEFLSLTPSVEHARATFRQADLLCAEEELIVLLQREDLARRHRANAHLLLASIHFVNVKDEATRRQLVKRELVELFLAERGWNGQLEIVALEFRTVLADARELAEWRYLNSPELAAKAKIEADKEAEIKSITDSLVTPTPFSEVRSANPWYTRWWAIGSGVGLVAMSVLIFSGGETATAKPQPADSLPGFPSNP